MTKLEEISMIYIIEANKHFMVFMTQKEAISDMKQGFMRFTEQHCIFFLNLNSKDTTRRAKQVSLTNFPKDTDSHHCKHLNETA